MAGHTQLANNENVQRSIQRPRDLVRNRDAAPRQRQDKHVAPARILRQMLRQRPASFMSIVKWNVHGSLLDQKTRPEPRECPAAAYAEPRLLDNPAIPSAEPFSDGSFAKAQQH